MNLNISTANALAADGNSLNALRLKAGQDSPAAIKEAARQFESLFMRELIKSMREATVKSGLMDSAQGDLGTDLLDQQLAVSMSGQPGGLSEIIARQLSQQIVPSGAAPATPAAPGPVSKPALSKAAAAVSQTGFVQRHSEAAARIEKTSGIPASFMIGQAGHETGWGRSEIKMKDGTPSYNLFGIKAGPGWTGKVAEVTTTEYVNGQARKVTAKFRAYESYDQSFQDYARLINESPRYAQARQQTGSSHAFASGLQRAGYATDPDYARKLSGAINATQRVQRLMV